MASLQQGWRVQRRVIGALMIRELYTRFGRENIGFLWMMCEPLLFAIVVAITWRVLRGPEEHGLNIVGMVITGYLPLQLFRNAVGRSLLLFGANANLLYHRQIKVVDFVFVRVLIEVIGTSMGYVFIGVIGVYLGYLPIPSNVGLFIAGWLLYALWVLSLCMVIAPFSEMSDILEKVLPVSTYVMIPFSGAFTMCAWLSPGLRDGLLWSPFVDCMELMRGGIFGSLVTPIYSLKVPIYGSMIALVVGLAACRQARRRVVAL